MEFVDLHFLASDHDSSTSSKKTMFRNIKSYEYKKYIKNLRFSRCATKRTSSVVALQACAKVCDGMPHSSTTDITLVKMYLVCHVSHHTTN